MFCMIIQKNKNTPQAKKKCDLHLYVDLHVVQITVKITQQNIVSTKHFSYRQNIIITLYQYFKSLEMYDIETVLIYRQNVTKIVIP